MNDTTKQLLRSLKATAGARFNAAKRVNYLDRRLTTFTALASAIVIALTIVPLFVKLKADAQSWIGLITILISLLILASSLLQYSCGFGVKSELYHRSALEIQELKRELQFKADGIDEVTFYNISKRYNEILQRYSLNHDDADFFRQQLEYPADFPMGWWEGLKKAANVFVAYQYPNAILAALIVGSTWVMVLSIE